MALFNFVTSTFTLTPIVFFIVIAMSPSFSLFSIYKLHFQVKLTENEVNLRIPIWRSDFVPIMI